MIRMTDSNVNKDHLCEGGEGRKYEKDRSRKSVRWSVVPSSYLKD